MADFAKFPDELVVCMQAGCSPGHPLTPTFCLGISHKLEDVSSDVVRSMRYLSLDEVKERTDGLNATVAEYEASIRSHMNEADFFVETADLAAKALLESEWSEHGGPVYSCHGCHHSWSFQKTHSPTCRVDAALTKLGYPDRASRDKALRKLRDDDFNERWGRPPKPGLTTHKLERPIDVKAGELVAVVTTEKGRVLGVATESAHSPVVEAVPDSPTSDPDFDSDPDDGGD